MVNKQNAEIDKADFKVKYNKLSIGALIFLIVFMILSSAVFPIYYLCDVPDGPPLEAAIGIACAFGAAAIVCVVLLFAFKRWRIEVSSEKIKFVPFFGKSREYGWEDISRVKRDEMYGRSIYNVYVKQREKKAFSFVSVMVGGQLFAEKLSERGLVSFGKFIHV
ncbi:MAG: hypothetical protein K2K39_01600 [Clostridia bacterium]|nr:hypothetical protein [Clostridia bacterium]